MNAREILTELDRIGVVVWWQDLGKEPQPPSLRFDGRLVPPSLAEEIRQNTVELHKIMRREASKKAPGIYHRQPRPADGGGAS